ncbi:MAG TPA: outer membrane protein assembly factor BamB [Steroidobacteraceae bacterium]|nr:outer membrane protein assembly factor BamB [Steroidobacteraceae bacterium]
MTRRIVILAAMTAALAALVACSHSPSKTKKNDKPTPLAKISAQFQPVRVWSTTVGKGEPKLRLGLAPAIDGNRVYAAGPHGEVVALDLATGRRLWQQRLKLALSGGPGAGSGLVLVCSSGGTVVALAAADGAERWRADLNSELLSAPVITPELAVIRTVDGKLYALESATGKQRWVTDQQVPRLSLRGTSRPVVSGDLVFAGFDNGRLMAVTLAGGTTAWDVAVGQPRGSSELQRLIDIDSPAALDGDDIFAVAFQGHAVRLARDSGREIWSHEISSYRGLAADAIGVYVSTAEGDVVRLDRASGAERWRQKALERRSLSAPALQGEWVLVTDYQGVIHWLKADDGSFVARSKGGARISAAPQVVGNLVIVQTDKGAIEAWRAPVK